MKIIFVAGARPNFMKIAPILRAASVHDQIIALLVHTGQHYDHSMSDSFFEDLAIKKPDYYLDCGGGTHAEQTAKVMVEFEKLCVSEKPDFVLVVGDVNSTIAAGLVAKKQKIKLIHVESGLRSGDRDMPEEINRLATDAITDIFFTTEKHANTNLLKEGHPEEKINFVGHVMIDNLYYQLGKIKKTSISGEIVALKESLPEQYLCMTLHRPSNVDNKEVLQKIITALNEIAKEVPIVFPCHPRTRKMIEQFGLDFMLRENSNLITLPPLGYNDFLYLWKDCAGMLTDSGGLQEETTALKVPCLTLRHNTERPITVEEGSNILIGNDMELLKNEVKNILAGRFKDSGIPDLWDGKSSERIIKTIIAAYCVQSI